MKIKICDYVAEFLRHQHIDTVFEMAGGMITQFLDSIHKIGFTRIVSVHHEQTAAFAADAMGRCKGKIGVAFATSGPGATNLLTGIASCFFDSSPAIFITGQVNTYELRGDKKVRQLGFQETDIVSMTHHITKKSFQLSDPNQFEHILNEAYVTAISSRPGPVLIDVPMNLQRAIIEVSSFQAPTKISHHSTVDLTLFDSLFNAIKQAKNPLILAGNGINCAETQENFLQLVDKLHIPVVTSLLGIDTIPYDHSLRAGFIGSYGNRWANIAIGTCDLLIVLGSRLDIRQTGADVKSFCENKIIFHIDCDSHEINNRAENCIPIVMDIAHFTKKFLHYIETKNLPSHDAWLSEIHLLKNQWPDSEELKNVKGINPNIFMHALAQHSHLAAGYSVDVGNHQMWAAQSLEIAPHQFFMTSGGMGAMGFALPAAIGASLAHNCQPIVVIAGDGCFQLNIQELQTVVRNKLPLKMIVLNNNSLGMIRQFQDNYFEGRYQSTYWGYSAPDFEKIALAYGIDAKTISDPSEINSGVSWLWENPSAPALLHVMIDLHANVYPKIAFGKPITEMEPFTQPISMEGT